MSNRFAKLANRIKLLDASAVKRGVEILSKHYVSKPTAKREMVYMSGLKPDDMPLDDLAELDALGWAYDYNQRIWYRRQ